MITAFILKSFEVLARPLRSALWDQRSSGRAGEASRGIPFVSAQPVFAGFPAKLLPAAVVLAASAAPFAHCTAQTAAPVFSPGSGAYHTVQTVTIKDATAGAVIYYTTDGTRPTTSSARYNGPITVGASAGFHALAIHGNSTSADVVGWYTIDLPTPAPVASVAPGTYNQIQYVTLTDAAPNATIYYTLDGTYPSTSSIRYTGPVKATTHTTITAIAAAPNYEVGSALRASYTIVAPNPVITPNSGVFQNSATITMSSAVAGAQIHYTSDGTLPTAASARYYSPIVRSQYQTVTAVYQAMATAPGCLPSGTTMATFIVTEPASAELAKVTVGLTPTRAIPGDFLGLSDDYRQPGWLMGQASTGINTPYQTLIKNLQVNNSSPMVYRISADDTSVSDLQGIVEPLKEFAENVNVKYVLGVDMFHNNVSLAESEAEVWKEGIPNEFIAGIEIGNESDNYRYNGARTRSYTYPDYLADFQKWQKGVKEATGFGVMGPSFGQDDQAWIPLTSASLESGAMTPIIVSQHGYAAGPTTNPVYTNLGSPWPLDALLTPFLATSVPEEFTSFAAAAHKAGLPFRISEMSSFWGGGIAGISNSFSSALWSIDFMFNYLQNGADGVNWNNDDAAYTLAHYAAPKNNSAGIGMYQITQVNPLYYGLLAFSQMANNGAQMLPVTTSTSANVSVWATIDSSSTVHVVVLNKDENATGKVAISVPGYKTGTVRYLTAAGYWATNGVTLGGQTFDGSSDGKIRGAVVESTIASPLGHFAISNMPIECAAVIDFTK